MSTTTYVFVEKSKKNVTLSRAMTPVIKRFLCILFSFDFRKLKITLPLPPLVHKMLFLIPLYFGFAVVYDIYSTIYEIVLEHTVSPGKVITQGVLTGILKNTSLIAVSNITTTISREYYNSTPVAAHWTTTSLFTST